MSSRAELPRAREAYVRSHGRGVRRAVSAAQRPLLSAISAEGECVPTATGERARRSVTGVRVAQFRVIGKDAHVPRGGAR